MPIKAIRREQPKKAASDAVEAASDLTHAVGDLATAGAHYASAQATRAADKVSHSPAAERTRSAAHTAGRRARRLTTIALGIAIAVLYQQVRSQPVPPHVRDT